MFRPSSTSSSSFLFCVGLIGLFHLNLMEVVEQTYMYISSHKFGTILKG